MMETSTLKCRNVKRRIDVRNSSQLNGLDYLEVDEDDQLTLSVYLLQKASEQLVAVFDSTNRNARKHIVIEGGRRIRGIQVDPVKELELIHSEDPNEDDYLKIVVDQPGDFSFYTLRLAAIDGAGRPTENPMPGIDPRYDRVTFSFKQGCPSDLDCKIPTICPPSKFVAPKINYLAKDYNSFSQLVLDRLSQIMPDWKERHVPDIGIAIVELLAYVGDNLSYYQDAVATEAYLNTARQRISVRRHARLVDYPMHEGCNARTWVIINTNQEVTFDPKEIFFITYNTNIPEKGQVLDVNELNKLPTFPYVVFEPVAKNHLSFYPTHNMIHFYTWGDTECCLPRGATRATLRDFNSSAPIENSTTLHPARVLQLQAGDVLIFEEVLGPKTGNPDDANLAHRCVVKLTEVQCTIDPLDQVPVVEIKWDEKDALPFPICISAVGPAPACEMINNISVAHGNVVLADHGQTIKDEPLGYVQLKTETLNCMRENRPEDAVLIPHRFCPQLSKGPLTFGQPVPLIGPAVSLLQQNPAEAKPCIKLTGSMVLPCGNRTEENEWISQPDLMRSNPDDRHFVVELDNDGIAHLRFGDNQLGRQPEVGEKFLATYRVGTGTTGKIGAEALSHVITRATKVSGLQLSVRNPMPAAGGVDPELLAEVKLLAPSAFQTRLERAITPDDYAELVKIHFPSVQKAAATMHWTGSWYEVLVAIDPFESSEAEDELLDEIQAALQRFRRMGHDLRVVRATLVPLDIKMKICVLPNHLRGHVKAELLKVFSNKVLADGKLGFFHPDQYTFGQAVRLSNLYAAAQAVQGVESINITRFERLFEGPNHELDNGLLLISPLEIARLDNDPNFPENGRLEFQIGGGR